MCAYMYGMCAVCDVCDKYVCMWNICVVCMHVMYGVCVCVCDMCVCIYGMCGVYCMVCI